MHAHAGALGQAHLWLWPLLLVLAAAYAGAARRRPAWSGWRSTWFMAGCVLLAASAAPGLSAWAHADLRGHMLQHLLLGMFAPTLLVLGAPVSLLLGALPQRAARGLVRLLHMRPLRWLAHPLPALVLNIGGMALLYLTPLYALSRTSAWLHGLVHWHFLAAGLLYAWAIAGPDPAPGRPSLRTRGMVLFAGMALHAWLAKAMYAHGFPRGAGAGAAELEAAARLMYYGGDLAELLLVVALFRAWYRRGAVHPAAVRTA